MTVPTDLPCPKSCTLVVYYRYLTKALLCGSNMVVSKL